VSTSIVFGVLQEFQHDLPARQVEIGRDAAELQIEVDQADAGRFLLVDIGQFPGEVDGKRRGARAAREVLHGEDRALAAHVRPAVVRRGVGGCRARGGVGGEFLDALDGVMQRAVGQRVGQEIVGAELQQLVQRAGRHGIGDDDHARTAQLRGADQLAQHADVGFVLGRDGEAMKTSSSASG
jgi:hypothetical protein